MAGEFVANRRYLHTNPELSFQEFNTQKYVAEQLNRWGLLLPKLLTQA
jgi:metal-dependent amidase/aminoacylase/carboxypeptidase family protein